MKKAASPSPPHDLPPLILASVELDQTFETLRRDLIQPFPRPPTSAAFLESWRAAEARSAGECLTAIEHWLTHCCLPETSDEALWFLCRRFDRASLFLQSLYTPGWVSPFRHPRRTVNEVLRWALNAWWAEHGSADAFLSDLDAFEDTEPSPPA